MVATVLKNDILKIQQHLFPQCPGYHTEHTVNIFHGEDSLVKLSPNENSEVLFFNILT